MTDKIKVIITAPKGAMDSLIVQEAYKDENIEVVGCIGAPGRDYIGSDAGLVCGLGSEIGVTVSDNLNEIIDTCDVVVDYSTTGLSMEVLDSCLRHGKGLLCGTTGFSDYENAAFAKASETIPIMKTANTSYVVTVMRRLLAEAAEKIGAKCKIEVIEMHDQRKLDAPSGTAIEMGKAMAAAAPDKTYDDIEFHSVRAGNTPSSHRVIFGCMGEKMEISHDAYDWRCYAIGACDGIKFLSTAAPGRIYTMDDVI
ncbi:MAG: 4-hydroxy-tetrahydrodipicolinate reductase [Firmicutes bacterium]|nr:4-hydroxy-tetrahydrodipicolinate reductase [Bacillota bacterium]